MRTQCTSDFMDDVTFLCVFFVQFARWRHQSDVRKPCLVEIARRRHRGRSLPSSTASCSCCRTKLVLECRVNESHTPSVRSPARTLVVVIVVCFFSALTLLVRWQEGHPTLKNLRHISPNVLFRISFPEHAKEDKYVRPLILGRKCTLAASRAAPRWVTLSVRRAS